VKIIRLSTNRPSYTIVVQKLPGFSS